MELIKMGEKHRGLKNRHKKGKLRDGVASATAMEDDPS